MTARPRLIAGNWKMHGLEAAARALAAEILRAAEARPAVDVAVFPPFTTLHVVRQVLRGSRVLLGAQACHEVDHGPHTGEISATMLADAGVNVVLCGHSERRAAGETDDAVGRRVHAVVRAGMRAIVCLGETLSERETGATEHVLARQFAAAFAGVGASELRAIDLAYEPVWAIGTGRNATPAIASEAHASLRRLLVEKFGEAGRGPRILYGGSVKRANSAQLLASPGVDGLLVGGASLDAAEFRPIIESA